MNKLAFVLAALLCQGAQAQQTPTPDQVHQIQGAMARQMQMMAAMVDVRASRLGFDETVATLRAGAEKRGWKPGEVVDMQAMMKTQGFKDTGRMKVLPACPAGANDKVNKAGGGNVPPLACRVTVFENREGKTFVMRMNTTGLAKLMQGEMAKALAEIGAQEDELMKSVLQD